MAQLNRQSVGRPSLPNDALRVRRRGRLDCSRPCRRKTLDALPHILASDRRYWIHATVAVVCLANLGNSWWVFWSLNALPEWTSSRFFLVLAISGLHYSIAALLSSPAPASVGSWRQHYWDIRVRLYSLALLWMALIALQNWALLDIPWLHPTRLVEVAGLGLFAAGVASADPRIHAGIAISLAVSLVIIAVGLYASAAPLALGN